jgi:hypothetical protein
MGLTALPAPPREQHGARIEANTPDCAQAKTQRGIMALELKLTGELDADAAVFIMCMNQAARFPAANFSEYASRVESLIEIHENVSCQRMMPESEEAHG